MTERFELIEAYSMNKLSASEAAAFEAEMAKDPALKNEVELQKDIISSIQNSRKIELKNRLANIDVKPGLTLVQKVGIGAVALSALLLLTYALVDNTTSSPTITDEPVITNEKSETEVVLNNEEEIAEPASEVIEEVAQPEKSLNVVESEPLSKENVGIITRPEELEMVQVPTLNMDDDLVEHDNLNNPESFEGTQEDDEVKGIIPSFESKNKKHRQYKYDGENLTLIGNFNSEEPYFLIEKPNKSETEMYLKFENTFYVIKETKKATDLEEVKNQSIINELSKK